MFIADLFESDRITPELAGAKAASLSRVSRFVPNVPPGYVILVGGFEAVIEANDIAEEIEWHLNLARRATGDVLAERAEKLQGIIEAMTFPDEFAAELYRRFDGLDAPSVAVRSSAPYEDSHDHSWAGQFESILGVGRAGLLGAIRRCWASLFSERALMYRRNTDVCAGNRQIAVLIQKMVPSEFAGVGFSVDPVTGDRERMVIEVVRGLGESLVSGRVTPTRYTIAKASRRIVDQTTHAQSVAYVVGSNGEALWRNIPKERHGGGYSSELSASLLEQLIRVIERLELHFGWPVDAEWASVGGEVHLTQVRPVTVIRPAGPSGETVPLGDAKNLDTFERYFGESRTVISAEATVESYIRYRGVAGNECTRTFSFSEAGYLTNYFYRGDLAAAYEAGKLLCRPANLARFFDESRRARESFETLRRELSAREPGALANDELLRFFVRYLDTSYWIFALYKPSQWEYTEHAVNRLKSLLSASGFDSAAVEEAFVTLTRLVRPDIVRREQVAALELSFAKVVDRTLLESHAHAFPWLFFNTFDRESCFEFLESRLEELVRTPSEMRSAELKRLEGESERCREEKERLLERLGGGEISFLAEMLTELAFDRHELKGWWAGAEFLFLDLFEAIASKASLSAEELLKSYRAEEIIALLSHGAIVSESIRTKRRDSYALSLEGDRCHWFEGDRARKKFKEVICSSHADDSHEHLRGSIANVGTAIGRVRIIRVEGLDSLRDDLKRFRPGEVLVTTMTQPTMLSLARNAAAIVTDEGGVTSHAAIIARELGIPCIVGTKVGTQRLSDGELVEVDARRGTVRRVVGV